MEEITKLSGAKTLLALSANEEYAALEINEPEEAYKLLYDILSDDQMTQATVAIIMAVERLRVEEPMTYSAYMDYIYSSLPRANNNSEK